MLYIVEKVGIDWGCHHSPAKYIFFLELKLTVNPKFETLNQNWTSGIINEINCSNIITASPYGDAKMFYEY